MNKRYPNYTLPEVEVKQLEAAIRSDERSEVVERATAVRMLHLGFELKAVAKALNRGHATISNWWKRYQTGGIEGLANSPRPGRPSRATEDYLQGLKTALETDPTTLGYPFTVWTVDRLREHLEVETGIQLSSDRVRVLMRQAGYVWRRPKFVLQGQPDAAAYRQAAELLAELKKELQTAPSNSSIWMNRP
jgi:transposase